MNDLDFALVLGLIAIIAYMFSCKVKIERLKEKRWKTVPTFSRRYHHELTHPHHVTKASVTRLRAAISSDDSFTWRDKGILQPLDQGDCGSCWAFATAGMFTDRMRISHMVTYFFSPFNLAACNMCSNGMYSADGQCDKVCNGNYLDVATDYLVSSGASHESNLNNLNHEVYTCDITASRVKAQLAYRVNKYSPISLEQGDPTILAARQEENELLICQEIKTNGPVSAIMQVCIDRGHSFYDYRTGDVYGSDGWTPRLDDGFHAIRIVGYGTTSNGVKYWEVANSWGQSWGDEGFFKIVRGRNAYCVESDVFGVKV